MRKACKSVDFAVIIVKIGKSIEIKLIGRLCCLQTVIHFKEKNFGPTPDGGEILVKVHI
jgi:hypothetical protein